MLNLGDPNRAVDKKNRNPDQDTAGMNLFLVAVLDKSPQTRWLKTIGIHYLTVLEIRYLKTGPTG